MDYNEAHEYSKVTHMTDRNWIFTCFTNLVLKRIPFESPWNDTKISIFSTYISQPHSTPVRVLLLLRHAQGTPPISGTKRAIGDPLVSKRPDFQGLFSYLRGSHGLSGRRPWRTKSRGPKGLRRAPRLLVSNNLVLYFAVLVLVLVSVLVTVSKCTDFGVTRPSVVWWISSACRLVSFSSCRLIKNPSMNFW